MNCSIIRLVLPASKVLQRCNVFQAQSNVALFSTQNIKKPPNPFFLFLIDKRKNMMKEEGLQSSTQTEMSVRLSKIWNQLSEEEKMPYQQKFEELKQKHNLNVSMLSNEELQRIKDKQKEIKEKRKERALKKAKKNENRKEGKPLRPLTAYMLFYRSWLKNMESKSGKSVVQLAKDCKDKWDNTSDDDKRMYIEEAQELKTQYDKDIFEFYRKMWKEDKHHLIPNTHKQKFIV